MACRPTSELSLEALRKLQGEAFARGDDCMALLLSGVELYLRAGRELELLETMRRNVEDMREAIENTPSAQDLKQLYERD